MKKVGQKLVMIASIGANFQTLSVALCTPDTTHCNFETKLNKKPSQIMKDANPRYTKGQNF